jgi:hypothetical protein
MTSYRLTLAIGAARALTDGEMKALTDELQQYALHRINRMGRTARVTVQARCAEVAETVAVTDQGAEQLALGGA